MIPEEPREEPAGQELKKSCGMRLFRAYTAF